jgi:methylenetetrahydrofolate--tRNA-(uracil-5-)-methyltransferase
MPSLIDKTVHVIGGGMAGSEAAWQLAELGIAVKLHEMKPKKFSPAHKLPGMAELVCSNSFGSVKPTTGSGMLKAEMTALNSFILKTALQFAVPAGTAIAVERVGFSAAVTKQIEKHPHIEIVYDEVVQIDPTQTTIVATGPLTSEALAKSITDLLGEQFLFFYDAVSPIVAADSLDLSQLFFASRYDDQDDYLNIPLNQQQYDQFIDGILAADKVPLHNFEEPKFFEACLPMDVLAARGRETLAFGSMKPVGLSDPKTGERPYAVIQLRRENFPTTMYSLVGCQNKLKWPAQEALFRTLPGLAEAKFVRLGSVHRNTFIHSPSCLNLDLSLRQYPNVYIAGQISGVEGYLESAAIGLMAGLYCGHKLLGRPLSPLPRQTILGSLIHYICNGSPVSKEFQPMNCNLALLPSASESPAFNDAPKGRRHRQARRENAAERAATAIADWVSLTS